MSTVLTTTLISGVAESSALGDFGYGAGDEPGFVAVSEAVEGEAGSDGVGPDARAREIKVAVGGGA